MENIQYLFEKNPRNNNKIKIYNQGFKFICDDLYFSGETIKKIVTFVNSVRKKYKKGNVPIYFVFRKKILIADKLSYVIFESICYHLIEKYGYRIFLYWDPEKHILADGIFSSPLLLLSNNNSRSKKKFLKRFYFDTYQNHYRKVITNYETENYLGIALNDIATFLSFHPISDENRNQIAEVISELIGNACEHTKSPCLLDIDVTNPHSKQVDGVESEEKYIGLNIAIYNYSDKLLGDDLKTKVFTNTSLEGKYLELMRAFNQHQNEFGAEIGSYGEVDFWNVACMQDKISGRSGQYLSGGTGCTLLIKSLQEKAEDDNCYVLSGYQVLYFKKNMLKFDDNGWVGFNNSADFFNRIPSPEAISTCPIYFPGTAYNLNFILKVEE